MKNGFVVFRLIGSIYRKLIANKRDEVNFWILLSFLVTFISSRLIVYNAPELFLRVRGVHIHHFSYGIIILALVGLFALNDEHHRKRRVTGVMYGIGLALAMDEFGMWIRLNDDYWIRHSYDAVFITAAILIVIVYFNRFWSLLFMKIADIIKGNKNIEEIEEGIGE